MDNEKINELSVVPTIEESQLPSVIIDQFKDADAIKQQIEQARNRAEEAKKKSEELQKVGKFGGGKKAAIEDLQDSAKMLAVAQEQTTLAQGLFFEYQEKLAKATKWLFELGVNNSANTDTIIRQLEIYMEGGSADELDELKQAEINAVIDRLLQQESFQKKQEKMWNQIDSLDMDLEEQHKINEQQAVTNKHNKEKDDEQDVLLAESKRHNDIQDEEINRQAINDEKHDLLFEKQQLINDVTTKEIDRLTQEISKLQKEVDSLNNTKTSKIISIVALIIAVVALGLSILCLLK
ncbi:MAG: hypothetical protein MJ172_07130 [Clostridia bacterium]|nr:hypothetical protein [Clostridia bacterium]